MYKKKFMIQIKSFFQKGKKRKEKKERKENPEEINNLRN